MERRFFIHTSVLTVTTLLLPWLQACRSARSTVIARPDFLSKVADEQTIRAIGDSYLQTFPSDKDAGRLEQLLVEGFDRTGLSNSSDLMDFFKKQIKDDFTTGGDRVIVVQGWVLSLTEARQCAFFSLTY